MNENEHPSQEDRDPYGVLLPSHRLQLAQEYRASLLMFAPIIPIVTQRFAQVLERGKADVLWGVPPDTESERDIADAQSEVHCMHDAWMQISTILRRPKNLSTKKKFALLQCLEQWSDVVQNINPPIQALHDSLNETDSALQKKWDYVTESIQSGMDIALPNSTQILLLSEKFELEKGHDIAALQPIIRKNAHRLAGGETASDDHAQAANLRLVQASRAFNPTRGAKFSTYAWKLVMSKSSYDAERHDQFSINASVKSQLSQMRRLLEDERVPVGRERQIEYLQEEMSLPRKRILDLLPWCFRSLSDPTSLERLVADQEYQVKSARDPDDENLDIENRWQPLRSNLADNNELLTEDVGSLLLRQRIEQVLKTLNYREREVIKLRYGWSGEPSMTWEELGAIFKVTRERVRQIGAKALRKLQQPSRSSELWEFVRPEFYEEPDEATSEEHHVVEA